MSTVTTSSAPLQIDWADGPTALGRPAPAPRPGRGRVTVRPRTGLTSKATWRELAYALLDLAPSVFFFCVLVSLIASGAGLAVIYVGVPVVMLALLLARLGGALQIAMARGLLRVPVLPPGPLHRRSGGVAGLVGAVLRDAAAWRAVLYFVIKIGLAPIMFSMAVGMYGYGLGAVTYPVWRRYLPGELGSDGTWHHGARLWNGEFVDTWPAMAAFVAVGLLVLLAAPHVLRRFVTADRLLVTSLLGRR